ncbi:MAG: hypothetical protein ACLR1V_11195 [Coprococcus sp.]
MVDDYAYGGTEQFSEFIGVINAFTPGPGNILALKLLVTNYGYNKGKSAVL